MIDQITSVIEKGFKPVLYIDDSLSSNVDLISTIRSARKLDIHICFENDTTILNRMYKAYVFRYGTIPISVESSIKRKGGIIVSGNF